MSARQASILPMQTSGIKHLLERTYREGGRYQWVREVMVNAMEAGAKRIEFGVDWLHAEKTGVYRRMICDDGAGMTAEQLTAFFNVFGAGGKAIGGVHENFGVGAKTSLLPWNYHGVVVLSWVNGDASMIWMRHDLATGEYGLRLFETVDPDTKERTIETVVEPFDDWVGLKPDWIKDHGTVIVLLGNGPRQDTICGDPHREEQDLKGISSYINRRMWEIPKDVEVYVEEVRTSEKSAWPRSAAEAYGPEPAKGQQDRRVNRRTIMGAKHYVEFHQGYKKGKLAHQGQMVLKDETKINWFLWEGERPGVQSYAAYLGYVGALYRNELYDVTSHLSTYRSFGVTAPEVRSKLWLIIEPSETRADGGVGVYPRTDRNALLIRGAGNAGEALPYHSWAAEFADNMPEPIREALRRARNQETGDPSDSAQLSKLAERFGARWKISKFRAVSTTGDSDSTVDPNQLGSTPSENSVKRKKRKTSRDTEATTGTRGDLTLGAVSGSEPASKVRVAGGIPTYRVVASDEMEPGMLASWMPHDPTHPEGVVLLNGDHPVLTQQIKYWISQYPDHVAPEIEKDVLSVYGIEAVAKVAHSEKFRGILPSDVVEKDMRSDAALTMSLLGLVSQEYMISARLAGKYGRRKAPLAVPVAQPVKESRAQA